MKTTFIPWVTLLASGLILSNTDAQSESFSEPPLVVYGKVIQVGEGASYQLSSGDLNLSLINEGNPSQVINLSTPLGAVGPGGAYSYRIEIPLKFQPELHELSDYLSVSHGQISYQFQSLTVDGSPATLLDPSLAQIITQFSNRALQQRVDLRVSLTATDTDGDGIPDWWEDLHGLNRHSSSDASSDTDGDGLSAINEFRNGTDPASAEYDSVVKTTILRVTAGGRAGLYLSIIDQNTAPADLILSILQEQEGLTWYRDDNVLPTSAGFSYADVLAGRITVVAASDFRGAFVSLTLHDVNGGQADAIFQLNVVTFSPNDLKPSVWLSAGSLTNQGQITEWLDTSGHERDGYQYNTAARPRSQAGESLRFQTPQFLYLDDRDLSLDQFTTFMAFDLSDLTQDAQTLFSSPDLQLRVGGEAEGSLARSLEVTQTDRHMVGPVLEVGRVHRIVLQSTSTQTYLTGLGGDQFTAGPSEGTMDATFTTLGGLRRLSQSQAEDYLQGGLREFLVFDHVLMPEHKARVDDYQLARWENWLAWDQRDETLPLRIQGADHHHNLIRGGWGADSLKGGPMDDRIGGGPGPDTLTGGAGADWFEFLASPGSDVITDFSEAEHDVIDLKALLGQRAGLPGQYIKLRSIVTRGEDDVPMVNSLLEVDLAGDGGAPDFVLTLIGLGLGNSDLPRLVGEGAVRPGGPRYETSVELAIEDPALIEADIARAIKATRTGNLNAAMKLNLSFDGTAGVDTDYRIEGAAGSGSVRTVSWERGQSETSFQLIPIADGLAESESIHIHALISSVMTAAAETPLALTLEDAAFLALQTTRHPRIGDANPGSLRIMRTGKMDQPLEVNLTYGGNLVPGLDYEALPAVVQMAPNESMKVLEVRLLRTPVPTSDASEIQVSLVPSLNTYALKNPSMASVIVIPESAPPTLSYANWKQTVPPGQDGLLTYLVGSGAKAGLVELNLINGFVELRFTSRAGLTDVYVDVASSTDLAGWKSVTHEFSSRQIWLENGQVQRIYRSNQKVTAPRAYYQISAQHH